VGSQRGLRQSTSGSSGPDFESTEPWRGTDIEAAVEDSCLGGLPASILDRLLADAHVLRYPAGVEVPRLRLPKGRDEPDSFQPPSLVADGLLRVFRRHVDDREVTARYVSAGDLIGLWGVLGDARPPALDARLNTEVIHDTVALAFDRDVCRAMLDDEPIFGRILCQYVFGQFLAAQDALAGSVLLPVRSRVAGHLLDMAERREHDLVVHATAQRLAAAAGSVREVVSRVLREMEGLGLVQRNAGELVLLDTAGLHRLASGEGQGGAYWAPGS